MIEFRKYQVVLNFQAPPIPKALFWFIARALENELKFFGHCTDIIIGNPIAKIDELTEMWASSVIPLDDGSPLEVGEFKACTY